MKAPSLAVLASVMMACPALPGVGSDGSGGSGQAWMAVRLCTGAQIALPLSDDAPASGGEDCFPARSPMACHAAECRRRV